MVAAAGSPAAKGEFCDKENAARANNAAAGKAYNAERERVQRGALERERIHGGVLAAI